MNLHLLTNLIVVIYLVDNSALSARGVLGNGHGSWSKWLILNDFLSESREVEAWKAWEVSQEWFLCGRVSKGNLWNISWCIHCLTVLRIEEVGE